MLSLLIALSTAAMAPPVIVPNTPPAVIAKDEGKSEEFKPPMPMNYTAWDKLSPELKRLYAAATVDALKWSYLFNDCAPLTPEEMIKGIEAGNRKDPVMIAVASTAYATCQD